MNNENDFRKQASIKEDRKLKAKNKKNVKIGLGFRVFGLVGWSVMVPLLLGIALGLWIDHHLGKGSHTATLICLLTGVILGVVLAMVLLARELFKKNGDDGSDNESN